MGVAPTVYYSPNERSGYTPGRWIAVEKTPSGYRRRILTAGANDPNARARALEELMANRKETDR